MESKSKLNLAKINKIINDSKLDTTDRIISFLLKNENNFSFFDLSKIAENANQLRMKNSAYYTDEELLELIEKELPDFDSETISILEPSVGVGNFLPIIFEKYSNKKIDLDVVDIDGDSIEILKALLRLYGIPSNVKIHYHISDFCSFKVTKKYDLAVGNPPFSKVNKEFFKNKETKYYFNKNSSNLASYFYEKCMYCSNIVLMVLPKNILNTPEFALTRGYFNKACIESIIDFGEHGFKGVLVETICMKINTKLVPSTTKVFSLPKNLLINQNQSYICDSNLPYWVIYRNHFFDTFIAGLETEIFDCFRDRQITNSNTSHKKDDIRVLKSRNISDDGQSILNFENYDEYMSLEQAKSKSVFSYFDRDDVYLTPNMTYKIRVMQKPKGYIVNGSIAILIPKRRIKLNKEDLVYFSSDNYREFMQIARNFQTRTLNVDATSVFFYGIRKK